MSFPTSPPATVAILTDFGTLDPYVGIMKGVIARIAPQARLVDLTHHIPPGDIRRAAFVLWQSYAYFPQGTVFLAVVDPGVGTARRALLLECGGYRFIGPDNGLFTYLWHEKPGPAYELRHPAFRLPGVSATFHGRDIFAPAAAYAALGVPGAAFGPRTEQPRQFPLPACRVDAQRKVHGEVLHADHFGNLLTSLGLWQPGPQGWQLTPWLHQGPPVRLPPRAVRLPSGERVPIVTTFADLPPGQVGALVGSTGLLELVVNGGSAARQTGLASGDPVVLETELLA